MKRFQTMLLWYVLPPLQIHPLRLLPVLRLLRLLPPMRCRWLTLLCRPFQLGG